MSKRLAIQGHSTRGNEVIELFQMMGGEKVNVTGTDVRGVYLISTEGTIETHYTYYKRPKDYAVFTLEEFLEKYPFKVGDKVIDVFNKSLTIKLMEWHDELETMVYTFEESDVVLTAEDLLKYNNKTSNDQPRHMYLFNKHDIVVVESYDKLHKWICEYKSYDNNQLHFYKGTYDIYDTPDEENRSKLIYNSFYDVAPSDIVRIASPGDTTRLERLIEKDRTTNHMPNVLAELLDHIKSTSKEDLEKEFNELEEWSHVGPTVEEFMDFCNKINKKPKYPTTYEECCQHLGCADKLGVGNLVPFQQLINARNAYWKIAGKEMGLDGPWKPDWSTEKERKYVIEVYRNKVRTNSQGYSNTLLAFPTAEMRDAFYENFKDLIERCKELL